MLLLLNPPRLSFPLLISCRILVEAYEGHFFFTLSRCSNHSLNCTARSYRRSPYYSRNLGHRDPARRGTTGTGAQYGRANPFIYPKHPDLGPSCQPHCPSQRLYANKLCWSPISALLRLTGSTPAHSLRLLAFHHVSREISPDMFANTRLSYFIDSGFPVKDLIAEYVRIIRNNPLL